MGNYEGRFPPVVCTVRNDRRCGRKTARKCVMFDPVRPHTLVNCRNCTKVKEVLK